MKHIAALIMSCFFSIVTAAIPPIPELPAFPPINSNNNTYHVNNEIGSDSTNDGSEVRPWKTFKFAAGKLRTGDTLIVHGTRTVYPMSWTFLVRSGNQDQWITIEGKDGIGGERVIFVERLSFGDTSGGSVSFIYLKNILFQGGGASSLNIRIYPGSHHIAFENIEIDCQSSPENTRGVWTDNHVRYVWFKDMNVHHCGYQRNAPTKPPPHDWKAPTDCGGICYKGDDIDEVVFLNVKAADNVGDGLGGGSEKAYGSSYFMGCTAERNTGDGFDLGGISTVIINSISRNNGGHQGAGYKFWSKESWLVNSVAYNNYSVGVIVRPQHDGESHAYILNSTFALNSTDRYGGQISTGPKRPENGKLYFYIHNNILYTLNSSAIVINNISRQIIKEESHNYYFSAYDRSRNPHWAYAHAIHYRDGDMKVVRGYSFTEMAAKAKWSIDTGHGVGDISVIGSVGELNSGFIDLAGGNLRLTEGSLAVDSGIDLGIVSDIDGTPVPFGVSPDMGAYEYTNHGVDGAPVLEGD